MTDALRDLVRRRADDRCEYCRMPQSGHYVPFEVDHVIAHQHGGGDDPSNLAWACLRCNRLKGPNLSSLDADGRVVRLFDPRSDHWDEHFGYDATIDHITASSPCGFATLRLLRMNEADYTILRRSLREEGVAFP